MLSSYLHNIALFLICISFFSCQEPYYPEDIDEDEKIIVVDGRITNLPGPYSVQLSWASPYNYDYVKYIHSAMVTISDDIGNIEVLQEHNLGIYKTSEDGLTGTVGRKYQLTIIMSDGSTYISTPVEMKQTPDISISAHIGKDYDIRSSYYGGVVVLEKEGIHAYIDLNSYKDMSIYFRFKVNYFRQMVYPDIYGNFTERCIEHVSYNNFLNLKEALQVDSSYSIRNHWIGFFPYERVIGSTLHIGSIASINIYGMNKEAFNYFQSINDQLQASEGIFDPVPTQIVGNIKCVDDTNRIALGLFEVVFESFEYVAFFWDGPEYCYVKRLDDEYIWPTTNSCDTAYVNGYWVDP